MTYAIPRRRSLVAAALLCLTLVGCGSLIPARHQTIDMSLLQSGNYQLDPDHAPVLFRVDHLGFSTYTGRFNTAAGTLDFDPQSPATSQLEVVIDAASIDTPSDALDDILRGENWFDTARFPTARFVSRKVTAIAYNSGQVEGDLTLHGVTKPVVLDVTFRGGADNLLTGKHTLGFVAKTTINRTEFGIRSLAPAIGAMVELEIHAEFQRIDG